MSNIQEIEIEEDNLNRAFTYYSLSDNFTYLIKVYNNKLELYDYTNNLLITTASLVENEVIVMNTSISENELFTSPEDYEKWGAYTRYKTSALEIDNILGLTVSQIAGLLGGWLGLVASTLTGLATIVYNEKYEDLYAYFYMSTNTYCPILVKEILVIYEEESNEYVGTEYRGLSWWGSPWDYTEPAACRVLAQKH